MSRDIGPAKLTVNMRILLCLLPFRGLKDSTVLPENLTQKGIAASVDIRWNHVPRAANKLIAEGLVEARKAHVEGAARRMKTYHLTREGIEFAKHLEESLAQEQVSIKLSCGTIREAPLYEANSILGTDHTLLQLYNMLSETGVIQAPEKGAVSERDAKIENVKSRDSKRCIWGPVPRLPRFIGRDSQKKRLAEWMEKGRETTMVIKGGRGAGKTALAARFLETLGDWNIFWQDVDEIDNAGDIIRELEGFLRELGKKDVTLPLDIEEGAQALAEVLADTKTMLVFDQYFEVEEEIVDLLRALIHAASEVSGVRMLVGVHESTPFYCRFYNKDDLDTGRVLEISLAGLSIEGTKKLLGNAGIDDDALKKVYLLTRGNPLSLELLRQGDTLRLKGMKGFSQEEVNLLMFLKTVDKEE